MRRIEPVDLLVRARTSAGVTAAAVRAGRIVSLSRDIDELDKGATAVIDRPGAMLPGFLEAAYPCNGTSVLSGYRRGS